MLKKTTITTITILIMLLTSTLALAEETNDQNTHYIKNITPKENQITNQPQQIIKIEFYDNFTVNPTTVSLIINNPSKIDVTQLEEEITITKKNITYTPPEIFSFNKGNVTCILEVEDTNGTKIVKQWEFNVDPSASISKEEQLIDIFQIVIYIIIGLIIGFTGFALYIIYLKKTKKFTFRKYFIQHPMQKNYLVIYLPIATAFLFIIFGLAYITNTPNQPSFSMEYVIILGLFIGITPLSIDSLIEKNNLKKYERAFSQFLFEMADAMRGGLDPAKAVNELAKTDSGIMGNQLDRAAEGIKIGRPFHEVITRMVKPFKSDLISRYAKLIGEASKVGGDASLVIYRAAKDMDDFIKVKQDRVRQLTGQVVTIYIAFSVLLIVIYLLLSIFPSLSGMDLSLINSQSLESAQAEDVVRMNFYTIKGRFLHVILLNSIGTGLVIGEFMEGKLKHGLIHIIILTIASIMFFLLMIKPL